MVHVYCGDGKGKSTAAAGLALRAAGNGMDVLYVQFMKPGDSGEIAALKSFENVDVLAPGPLKSEADGRRRFTFQMSAAELEEAAEKNRELLRKAASEFENGAYAVMILDEAVTAAEKDFIDEGELLGIMRRFTGDEGRELVVTGHVPTVEILDAADYVTDMEKIKHPFDRGIAARKGIEF